MIRYKCDDNHQLSSSSVNSGTLSTPEVCRTINNTPIPIYPSGLTCEPIPTCGTISSVSNGNINKWTSVGKTTVSSGDTFYNGDLIQTNCNSGYNSSNNNKTITCNVNNIPEFISKTNTLTCDPTTTSPPTPTCPYTTLENASIQKLNNNTFGVTETINEHDLIRYKCDDNHQLSSSSVNSGTLSTPEVCRTINNTPIPIYPSGLTCEPIPTCGTISSVSNGNINKWTSVGKTTVSSGDTFYNGDLIQTNCNSGYNSSNNNKTITCNVNNIPEFKSNTNGLTCTPQPTQPWKGGFKSITGNDKMCLNSGNTNTASTKEECLQLIKTESENNSNKYIFGSFHKDKTSNDNNGICKYGTSFINIDDAHNDCISYEINQKKTWDKCSTNKDCYTIQVNPNQTCSL